MPTRVTVREGECLCCLAMNAGFLDCQPLRDEPANASLLNRPLTSGDVVTIPDIELREVTGASDKKHSFVKKNAPPVSIRFVHGSPKIPYLQDLTVSVLQVSNHVTDKGGLNDNVPFPDKFEFQQPGHDDPDTFKVEVVDPKAGAEVKVILESLRRLTLPNGTFAHDVFPGAEKAKRTLDGLVCKKVKSGVAYRSKYLRLVTDEVDQQAKPAQTLLVTDMTDQGDSSLEILEQKVRATYVIDRCPAPAAAKCRVSVEAPVGSDADARKPRLRLKLAVHILRLAPGGAAVVSIADADRRVHKWVRRVYAQAGIAPILVQTTRLVDPVANLIAISDPAGASAAGDGQLGFRVSATGKTPQVIGPITPAAGDTPATTAQALANLVQSPYTALVSVNPARFTDPPASRSADIVIREQSGARVTIDQEVSTDSRQTLTVGRPNPASLQSWDGTNFLVGSIEQRTLLKNYDTGTDRVDILVVQAVSAGNRGEAMMSGHQIDPNRPAIDPVKFSAFLTQITMDGTDNNPFSFPHECGHVAMELIHATGRPTELMTGGTSGATSVNATKRIREAGQGFDRPAGTFLQLDRLHTDGAPLLDPF